MHSSLSSLVARRCKCSTSTRVTIAARVMWGSAALCAVLLIFWFVSYQVQTSSPHFFQLMKGPEKIFQQFHDAELHFYFNSTTLVRVSENLEIHIVRCGNGMSENLLAGLKHYLPQVHRFHLCSRDSCREEINLPRIPQTPCLIVLDATKSPDRRERSFGASLTYKSLAEIMNKHGSVCPVSVLTSGGLRPSRLYTRAVFSAGSALWHVVKGEAYDGVYMGLMSLDTKAKETDLSVPL